MKILKNKTNGGENVEALQEASTKNGFSSEDRAAGVFTSSAGARVLLSARRELNWSPPEEIPLQEAAVGADR